VSEQLYKVLARDGDDLVSCNGGHGKWTLNRWRSVSGELVPCKRGIHLCREQDLLHWLGEVIWTAEYKGERIDCEDKIVVQRARITSICEHWNERTQRLFAVDCARIAVNRYAQADQKEMLHACLDVTAACADDHAAWAAAWDAARAAAWAAAWDAAWAAARAAARDAALAAARAAAWDAAWAAARAAARAAAGDAARAEQTALLMRYLSGEEGPFVEEGDE